MPSAKEFQQPKRDDKTKDSCIRLLNNTITALQQWYEPIDILMVFYGLVNIPDVPLPKDMKNDKFFNTMQAFYSELNKIPRDLMFVYNNYPYFSQKPIREVAARLKLGRPVNKIGDTREVGFEMMGCEADKIEFLQVYLKSKI
jgi:hypothetical protein